MAGDVFPEGTTWQQVHDEFIRLEAGGVTGATAVIRTLDDMHTTGPDMQFEEEVLDVFRYRYHLVLGHIEPE